MGLIRFPDIYTRLHATGLVSTGGIALLLLGVIVHFATRSVTLSVLAALTLVFVLLTYPLASTAIISAAHRTKSPKVASNKLFDELEEDESASDRKPMRPVLMGNEGGVATRSGRSRGVSSHPG